MTAPAGGAHPRTQVVRRRLNRPLTFAEKVRWRREGSTHPQTACSTVAAAAGTRACCAAAARSVPPRPPPHA